MSPWMADNPAEYVAKIEAELRVARRRVEELELALAHSDEIRGALVTAAADASRSLVTALERLEIYQSIVDAAVWYVDGRDNELALDRLVELAARESERRGKAS